MDVYFSSVCLIEEELEFTFQNKFYLDTQLLIESVPISNKEIGTTVVTGLVLVNKLWIPS